MDEQPDYTADLAAIIDETLGNGGNVIIPSFAVGRTQELAVLHPGDEGAGPRQERARLFRGGGLPLASEATRIFSGDLHGYLDEEAIAALKGGALFQFPGLTITESSDESRALNLDPTPKVIISASGMCDAGRIRHHLKHNLWRPECAVVFVGYQAEGDLGRRLLNGVGSVKLFGEEIAVRARIVNFHGLSSHADRDGLLRWIEHFSPRPRQVFVVHGDQEVTEVYANTLREKGLAAHAPNYEEVYDLLDNQMLSPGLPPEKKPEPASGGSPTYQRLEDVGRRLMEVIAHNKGGTNKDLGRFADQLRALIEKWDR
ncbi:MAG: MBL fold metallo-hydrolase RNA specificity domain-containing protein [Flavonifractor plautii]